MVKLGFPQSRGYQRCNSVTLCLYLVRLVTIKHCRGRDRAREIFLPICWTFLESILYICIPRVFAMASLLRPRPQHLLRFPRCYSTAQAPAINVTSVPAPHSGSIKILSLNRPAARNAISRQLLAELNLQITSIHNEGETGSTRALILASDVDSSFCAGADLKERATFTQEEWALSTS